MNIMKDLPEPLTGSKTFFGTISSWFKGRAPSYGKKTPIYLSRDKENIIKLNKIPNGSSAIKHSPASKSASKPQSKTPSKTTPSKTTPSTPGSKTRKSSLGLGVSPKPINDMSNRALVNHLLLRPEKKNDFTRKAVIQFIPSWLKRGTTTTPDIIRDRNCYRKYTDFFDETEVDELIRKARNSAMMEIPRPEYSSNIAKEMMPYIKKVTALTAAVAFKLAYGEMCDDFKVTALECDKDECLLAEATNIARIAAFKVARELFASIPRHSR